MSVVPTAATFVGDTALSVAATMSMVHLLKEAWTEATQVQGPPPTDPTHRRHSSAEQAVLEELDKTVGEYDSEVERATPTSLEVTPPKEADCVFFEDGDGGPSRHPKAFMTEVGGGIPMVRCEMLGSTHDSHVMSHDLLRPTPWSPPSPLWCVALATLP